MLTEPSDPPETAGDVIEIAAVTEETGRALPCDAVRELDRQSAARAAASGVPLPPLEQWPPLSPWMNPWEGAEPWDAGDRRPCGDAVDAAQAQAEASTSLVNCFLPDGRFGTQMIVDMLPVPPATVLDHRPPQDGFDAACRSSGWDRGHP
ncbi:hypothetical protein [Prescottella subtropica]|uniref:hypothetical protein n=1 Tax=Prescottella subtropica TaxID=2545757 RepID=UPI0010F6AD1B|nr:hypothetical protein [Prescottella subtropica]